MTSLKEAARFHGHLGPYLILGVLAGEFALKKLRAKRHFGLEVKAGGADKKPKSCLIDGLQLSTGATYGKGNIRKIKALNIKITFINKTNNKKLILSLKDAVSNKLNSLKGHRDSEKFAKGLYRVNPEKIFNIN